MRQPVRVGTRRAVLISAVVLVPVLVGCSSSTSASSAPTTTPAAPTTDGPSPAPTATTTPASAAKNVVVYGDAPLVEARSTMERLDRASPAVAVTVRAQPASAPCDWQKQLESDLQQLQPNVVLLELSGNASTPCMNGADGKPLAIGSSAYYDKYDADLSSFFGAANQAGAKVLFVEPVPVADATLQTALDRLTTLAARNGSVLPEFQISTNPRAAVSADGKFAATLPCLPTETTTDGCRPDGSIPIRDAAGLHFCPSGYADNTAMLRGCPTYSSGAVRFGKALYDEAANAASPNPAS